MWGGGGGQVKFYLYKKGVGSGKVFSHPQGGGGGGTHSFGVVLTFSHVIM